MKKKIMFSFSLNFGQKIIIKEYIYIYISFILGVRAALFALVHGLPYHCNSERFIISYQLPLLYFYHGLLLFLSPTNSKK